MIDCDASENVIGAVFLQQQNPDEPKEWATVGFFSKTLSKEQRNYSATERECYAGACRSESPRGRVPAKASDGSLGEVQHRV